jgi:hypothetical protein
MIKEPIFLVGAERSGTTLLRLMLCHHSQIAWCNEFEYAVDQIPADGVFPNLSDYYNWLDTHRIFQGTGFTIDKTLSYPQLVDNFLLQKRADKTIVGATVHRHFDRLLSIWPEARFIHLIRDARDVANSCIGAGWAGNVWNGCERWQEAELLWDNLAGQLTRATRSGSPRRERYISVTYEELISQYRETLTKLCEFIGVSYEEAMLDYAQNSTYDIPDSRFISQWKKKLSDYEVRLVESRVGELLSQRGYPLSGLSPVSLTKLDLYKLKLQNWSYRANYRRKRYGNYLFITDYISRKLNFEDWQKHIKIQLNNIDAQKVK